WAASAPRSTRPRPARPPASCWSPAGRSWAASSSSSSRPAVLHPLLAYPRALGPYLLLWLVPATLLVGVPLVHEPALWRASVAVAVPLCALYAFACLGAWFPAQGSPP